MTQFQEKLAPDRRRDGRADRTDRQTQIHKVYVAMTEGS